MKINIFIHPDYSDVFKKYYTHPIFGRKIENELEKRLVFKAQTQFRISVGIPDEGELIITFTRLQNKNFPFTCDKVEILK